MNYSLSRVIFIMVSVLFLSGVADEAIPSKYVKNYSVNNDDGHPTTDYLSWEYENGTLQPQSIQPIQVVESISDGEKSIYFRFLFSIISTPDGYLFTNETGANLVFSDKNFFLKKIIGNEGSGPGELAQPRTSFITEEGSIWTDGTSNRGFVVHNNNGQVLYNFKPRTEIYNASLTKFLVKDSKVYYSTPDSENPITVLDNKGNPTQTFGEPIDKFAKDDRIFEKRGHLLPYDRNSFLLIGESGPVIQRYSYTGKLLEEHNWVDHPHFKSFFKGTKIRQQSNRNTNTAYLLFQDVTIADDKSVIALAYDYDSEGKVSCNSIVKLARENGEFFIDKVTRLNSPNQGEKTWYESIAIDEQRKRLLAFDYTSSSIHVFELDKVM